MENSSTYKNLDLRKVTMYDIAELFTDQPPLLISPDDELSDENIRILGLVSYADYYKLTDLKEKLQKLFKDELLSFNS
ncbi:hypothetical protein FNJ88_06370 [Chryseobacterium sp. SNU WT5]|uniref:hypothetical protein n=1 Tax=Chryseobacterium sp. SNU WT5 TaxID=2594269 RepID=UPI001181188C|nr:hypothetical protein [Chryseobacterium sp. SNU WT5]QDP85207.1 hypothetical protein FNJ88_06370 [Chryseobacterium sp. SNU WT5]